MESVIEEQLPEDGNTGETENPEVDPALFYKDAMRNFVKKIGDRGKQENASFLVVPQNGIQLVTKDGTLNGELAWDYLNAIDGHGQESLFYGQGGVDAKTKKSSSDYLVGFLEKSKQVGNTILVTDYCFSEAKVDQAFENSNANGFISFSAHKRELTEIPVYPRVPLNVNDAAINNLSQVKNFLYLLNYTNFSSKTALVDAVAQTDYDLLIVDAFFNDGSLLGADTIASLSTKNNGAKRLVLAYMSIGEAEVYRYYWQADWANQKPDWLDDENENWPGNYKVKYWQEDWQEIIIGESPESYMSKILQSGFDGVYLDIIDGFQYFENKQ